MTKAWSGCDQVGLGFNVAGVAGDVGRDEEDEFFAAQFAALHFGPVAFEPFVTDAADMRVRDGFRLAVVAGQFGEVVGINRPLELGPHALAEVGEQAADLVLIGVQVRDARTAQIGWLQNVAFAGDASLFE